MYIVLVTVPLFDRGTQRQFSENICSDDDLDLEFSEHLL